MAYQTLEEVGTNIPSELLHTDHEMPHHCTDYTLEPPIQLY